MSKIYSFINECGSFFVLTLNGNFPAGRPFGAIMEIDEKLYIQTTNSKPVYRQLKENQNMQIVAMKPGTREWIRVNGIAKECEETAIKEKMFLDCPVLKKHYSSPMASNFNVFEIEVLNAELN